MLRLSLFLSFSLVVHLMLLTHFGETPEAEILFPPRLHEQKVAATRNIHHPTDNEQVKPRQPTPIYVPKMCQGEVLESGRP